MLKPTISYLTDIYFGAGMSGRLGELCDQLGIERPLLVTDEGLVACGIAGRLSPRPTAVFADVPPNPDEESVLRGRDVFHANQCDGIVALGGGSPIDCAKAISILATHAEPLDQYAVIKGGLARITSGKPPLVAVPTTAGTGSEVGRASLITMRSGEKLGLISRHVLPTAAVCDPELTLDLPPVLTAATGMDAITHCVETYCSPAFNPVADAIALDGLARAWTHLPRAMEEPHDLDARAEMMMASTQGALAFQKGLGMVHSLSHPLGGLRDKRLHHGTLNAVFLPHVIRFNAESCPGKMAGLAGALGVTATGAAVAAAFERRALALNLPARLRDLGVTRDDLDAIPEAAMCDHSTPSNPRAMDAQACRRILDIAY